MRPIKHPGEIHRAAHGQMTAVGQIHAEIAIPRFEHSEIDGHVRLRSGMGLNISVIGAEQFFGARNRQRFDFIDELTAAVIPLSRIPFGIFVSHDATLSFQHCFTDNVFRSNELEVLLKPIGFLLNAPKKLRDRFVPERTWSFFLRVTLFLGLIVVDANTEILFNLGDLFDTPLVPSAGERGFEPHFYYRLCDWFIRFRPA